MPLDRLTFQELRNLQLVDFEPCSRINLITGSNGSGKTSLLEGIHVLGMGRSFRTRHMRHVIADGAEALVLHGRLAGEPPLPFGVRRRRDESEIGRASCRERVWLSLADGRV